MLTQLLLLAQTAAVAAVPVPATVPLRMSTHTLASPRATHIWGKHPGDGQASGDGERHVAVQHDGFICVGPQVLHWEH